MKSILSAVAAVAFIGGLACADMAEDKAAVTDRLFGDWPEETPIISVNLDNNNAQLPTFSPPVIFAVSGTWSDEKVLEYFTTEFGNNNGDRISLLAMSPLPFASCEINCVPCGIDGAQPSCSNPPVPQGPGVGPGAVRMFMAVAYRLP